MSGAAANRWSSLLGAVLAGATFGLGLAVSGMSDPRKVRGFLDVGGHWDPSLAFVMAGAIAVAAGAFAVARRRHAGGAKALLGSPLPAPTKARIDAPLFIGALLFGVGWGVSGFCPGPALLSLASLNWRGILFVFAMLVGVRIHAWLFPRKVWTL